MRSITVAADRDDTRALRGLVDRATVDARTRLAAIEREYTVPAGRAGRRNPRTVVDARHRSRTIQGRRDANARIDGGSFPAALEIA